MPGTEPQCQAGEGTDKGQQKLESKGLMKSLTAAIRLGKNGSACTRAAKPVSSQPKAFELPRPTGP